LEKPQNPDRADPVTPPAEVPPAEAPAPAPAAEAPADEAPPPLTPAAWLSQNGIYLAVIAAVVGVIVYKLGLSGLWQCFLVVIGLGFVIFIHELGHFLTAKWCDVHVQTFSLGFGPALPGCSFRYGETLYKIALIPLGGYVGMVGEGTDADEDEDYPRSFKNKTVGQRMLIISAGVLMNVLFGCLAFVAVYRFHGVERHTTNIDRVEAGSPAWQLGVRSGSRVTLIGKTVRLPFTAAAIENPDFEAFRAQVVVATEGDELAFRTQKIDPYAPEGGDFDGVIKPRRDKNDPVPIIGVAPAPQLVLYPSRAKSFRTMPVGYTSAAAAARVLDLAAGAAVVEATDPDDAEKTTPVSGDWFGRPWPDELAERMRKLRGKPMVLKVRPAGATAGADPVTVEVPAVGFQWDDVIVAMTRADQDGRYDPFAVEELPLDKAKGQARTHDYFEFRRRMKELAGRPVVIQVRRKGEPDDARPTSIFVPPEYHRSLGARMRMGEVAAVRNNSPAAAAGLQAGDVILHVTMVVPGLPPVFFDRDIKDKNFDPIRLPGELDRLAADASGSKFVTLTVERRNSQGGAPAAEPGDDKHEDTKKVTVGPMIWDDSWRFDEEYPSPSMAALAIPGLGIAYRVDSTIVAVEPGSPADKAGLKDKDEIIAIAFRQSTENPAEVKWSNWAKLEAKRDGQERFDRWAYIDLALQSLDYPHVQLKVRRINDKGEKEVKTVPEDLNSGWVTAEEDATWPEAERGLMLTPDHHLQKASTTWEALQFGVSRTGEFILQIYQVLRGLVTQQISIDVVQGPINIAQTAFYQAEDPWEFMLFLALISVNLAVVNFLPIPILDGGHMVFLVYEKLRGKPASDTVRYWATVGGLALLGVLFVFILWREAVMPFVRWMWRV
jgi:membrane-associated protease RseP (regulator of RpoE activity)